MCCIPKPLVKEHNIPEIKDKSNYIHEHNYSCYKCLDGIKARSELNRTNYVFPCLFLLKEGVIGETLGFP